MQDMLIPSEIAFGATPSWKSLSLSWSSFSRSLNTFTYFSTIFIPANPETRLLMRNSNGRKKVSLFLSMTLQVFVGEIGT